MAEQRLQNQIAIYMTNKKLCELNDKLKPAPIDYYAHIHAQGEKTDGSFIRNRSCIGIVLQDYSRGTGSNTVRVTANLSPEFFPYALSRVTLGVQEFDFHEEKIFGEPDTQGLSTVTKVSVKRASVGRDGLPRNYPWCVMVENGRAIKDRSSTGGVHMRKGSYVKAANVFVNINDYDFYRLMQQTVRYIHCWELTYGPYLIQNAMQCISQQRSSAQ